MAQSYVARELEKLGGLPKLREGFISDNGNVILDVTGMNLEDPSRIEVELSLISGVVAVGLFARRGADRMLIGGPGGVRMIMTKGDGK
jgi:ribose 5-phosphate isomerase A